MRVVFKSGPTLISEHHYYPFGLNQEGSFYTSGTTQKYKYNGKELVCSLGWYDYGARWYGACLGRWGQIDPLIEKYTGIAGYSYVANNPINSYDPDGRYIIILAAEGSGGQHFLKQIQNAFGGNVRASFTKGGEARLQLEQTGKLSESQQAAFDILSGYTNNTENGFIVAPVEDKYFVEFESYNREVFKPSNFDVYPEGDNNTRGLLAHYVHFFAEQYYKQVELGVKGEIINDNKPETLERFNRAHEYALEKESKVSGVYTRDLESREYGPIHKTTFENRDKNGKKISTYIEYIGGVKPKIVRQ